MHRTLQGVCQQSTHTLGAVSAAFKTSSARLQFIILFCILFLDYMSSHCILLDLFNNYVGFEFLILDIIIKRVYFILAWNMLNLCLTRHEYNIPTRIVTLICQG